MIQLEELIGLIPKNYPIYTSQNILGERVKALLSYVRSADTPSDTKAAQSIGLKADSAKYRKVKHALKHALINAVVAIKPVAKNASSRSKNYVYVWKLISVGKILRTKVGSQVLLPYLEEAFKIASKEDMVHAAFESATMLRRQYNNRTFNREKYLYYAAEARRYREISRSYHDAIEDLNEINYMRNIRENPDVLRSFAQQAYERHAHLVEKFNLAMVSYIVYLIEINIHLASMDYEKLIEVADKAINYLDNSSNVQSVMYQVFEANLAVAYTQLNDYENGMDFAQRLLAKTSAGHHNYIKVHELMLVLTLRAGKLQKAYDIFIGIDQKKLSKDLLAYYRETFHIIEAYLFLLISLGQIKTDPENKQFTRFRMNKFLNSLDHSINEKSHRNVHLLIIQIIDNIVNRRHAKTLYSIESITKYSQRHLSGQSHKRAKYFMKALAQLSAQQFHRTAVERHTARYLDLLRQNPSKDSKMEYSMELVPYELLWQLILDQLGYRRLRQIK